MQAFEEVDERDLGGGRRHKSREFCDVDDSDGEFAAHGDVLRTVIVGAPHDFAEFRLGVLQFPGRAPRAVETRSRFWTDGGAAGCFLALGFCPDYLVR